jgi:hypothetical protein
MAAHTVYGRQGVAGLLAIVLALLGLMFFWIQPIGLILSGAGILAGVLGVGMNYSAGGRPLRQATAGLILAIIALLISLSIPLILHGDLPSRIMEPARQTLPTPTD